MSGLRCKATDCAKTVPYTGKGGRKLYCSARCVNRMKARRKRAKKRREAMAGNKGGSLTPYPHLTAEESKDGRASPRRGPQYEEFCRDGWPDRIQDGLVNTNDVSVVTGFSTSNISRWMAAWREDVARAKRAEGWETPQEAVDSLKDFVAFRNRYFRLPGNKPYHTTEFHLRWVEALLRATEGGKRVAILSPPRHGKAIDVATPMLTRRGWVDAGDVKVGDQLVGSNGRWTDVRGVYPRGVTDAWRVTFSDGASLVTCGEHRWQVRNRYTPKHAKVRTTAELKASLTESDGRSRWRVPLVHAIVGDYQPMPLHPYLLGCWLGDGTTARGEITTEDDEILEAFASHGYKTSYRYDQTSGRAATYGLPGLVSVLRGLGVLNNKHVPDVYLYGQHRDRLRVLQGMCDTDGTVAKNGSQQSYSTTNPRLAKDFKFLVNSLGGTWTERVREVSGRTSASSLAWEIWFRLPLPHSGFRLRRKHERLARQSPRNKPRRFVKSVERVEDRETVCFAVAAEDHLFAAGPELILTHNTELLIHTCIWLICRNPNIRIMWVGGNEDIAADAVGLVMQELESNDALMLDFVGPDGTFKAQARSGKKWTRQQFTVSTRTAQQKAPTMVAIGKGGKLLSRDADLIVADDIEDEPSTRQQASRDSTKNWWNMDLSSRKMKHTGWVCIGSRQHPDDLYSELIENAQWEVIVERAHDDAYCEAAEEDLHSHTDCVLWPELRDYEFLMDQRAAMGAHRYELNYNNNAASADLMPFVRELVEPCRNRSRAAGDLNWTYNGENQLGGLRLVAGLDPATSGFQASFLWAVHSESGTRFMIDLENSRKGGIAGAVHIMRDWLVRYGCRHWVVESNATQTTLIDNREMQEFVSENGIRIDRQYTSRVNKHDSRYGVTSLASLMAQQSPLERATQRIDLPYLDLESKGKVDSYVRQLLNYTGESTKRQGVTDLVMAAWFPEQVIQKQMRGKKTKNVQRKRNATFYPSSTIRRAPWRAAV